MKQFRCNVLQLRSKQTHKNDLWLNFWIINLLLIAIKGQVDDFIFFQDDK